MEPFKLDDFFLILGCQRSGTTLMRLVLGCHSKIECHDEGEASRLLAGLANHPAEKGIVGLKLPQLTEQFGSKMLKTDAFYQNLKGSVKEFPNPYSGQKLIFLIRDPRDVIASMLKLGPWLERYGRPVLDFLIANDEAFQKRYAPEIARVRVSRFPRVAQAALIWKYKVDASFEYRRRGYPILPVRYEALVASPATELARICTFLGVPWEEAVLEHARQQHSELEPNGLTIGNSDPGRAIDDSSVGRWKTRFTRGQIEEIVTLAGVTYAKLYPQRWH